MSLSEYISSDFLHVLSEGWNHVLARQLFAILVVAHTWNILSWINTLRLVLRFHFSFLLAVNVDDIDVKCDILKLQKLLLSLLVNVKLAVLL